MEEAVRLTIDGAKYRMVRWIVILLTYSHEFAQLKHQHAACAFACLCSLHTQADLRYDLKGGRLALLKKGQAAGPKPLSS